jgi:Skp family chaperone for outer membrane proteins
MKLNLQERRPRQSSCSVRRLYPFNVLLIFIVAALLLYARDKSAQQSYGMGLSVSVAASEQELRQAVQDVVSDGIIQGSKEYNKDEYVAGAEAADSTPVFPKWTGPGQAFYKLRKNALDPRNFKDSGDSGTLVVRYVVQPGDDKNAVLKIDASFVDDFHRRPHLSNGSVEAAEYAAIQDHLAAMHLQKQRADQEQQSRQQELATKELERQRKQQQLELSVTQAPGESLEEHVQNLRRDAERLVKSPGGKLRSAPFRSATSLKSLPAGTEVVILVSTPYWYGVETKDGQHGWLHRSELEPLP